MAWNIPEWAGDPGKIMDGEDEMLLLRVEPDGSLTDLGEHTEKQSENLARQLSLENVDIEYLVDRGTRADIYKNGSYWGTIRSSTSRSIVKEIFGIAKGLNTGK